MTLLLLLSLLAGPAGVPTQPWGPVPDDWVFAEQEGIDSWPGLYHDRVSGVCVQFDVAWPSVVSHLKRSTESLPPEYSGVPARLTLTSDADCKGGRRLSTAFLPKGEGSHDLIWNAYADACNDAQLRRAKDFLFTRGAGPLAYPLNPDRGTLHARATLQTVADGASYSEVRTQLGAASWAECGAGGSLIVSWYEGKPHFRTWEFTFSQAHVLVRKRRR